MIKAPVVVGIQNYCLNEMFFEHQNIIMFKTDG